MIMTKTRPLWAYIREREKIRLKKQHGVSWPWTKDEILQKFKFTNVKRIHDRTTQAFLKVYWEHPNASPDIALLNCAVRRFTGTAQASETIGWLDHFPRLGEFRSFDQQCDKLWTGAYMIRAGDA